MASVSDAASHEQRTLVHHALDSGAWLHTGFDYHANNRVLAAVNAGRVAGDARIIAKVKAHSAAQLAAQIDGLLADTGARRLAAIQLADNPRRSALQAGGELRRVMEDSMRAGKVGGWLIELFWEYSENLGPLVEDAFFDGTIFYFNALHREVTNDLFSAIRRTQRPIAALKALGGGMDTLRGDTGRAAVNRFVPIRRRRFMQHELNEAFRESGCADEAEFRYRFLLSFPQVRWIVGGTSTRAHLDAALRVVQAASPLPPAVVERIVTAQERTWSKAGLRIGSGTERTFLEKVQEKLRAARARRYA
jgi:aryl-alcohol dehydrogenase-like predicted oxidoreductase